MIHKTPSFRLFFFIAYFLIAPVLNAQLKVPASFGDGLTLIAEDSSFLVNMGFRFQTLYDGKLDLNSSEWSDQMLIRRSRLKFKGYALSKAVRYKLELGLANRDIAGGQTSENGDSPNIVYDAYIDWKMTSGWSLQIGQAKQPGNRERIISSQQMQFVDRSLLNARFNLDRDVGIQLRHTQTIQGMILKKTFSIAMGEGRNTIINNQGGYNYTARVEVLPFGKFQDGGAYFGSDLAREPYPKLAVAVVADYNDGAVRSRGQLGKYVYDEDGNVSPANITTFFADAIYKHKGFSAMSEFAWRWIESPGPGFTTGTGFVLHGGYLLKSNWEFAGRFSGVWSNHVTSSLNDESHYTMGISRYVSGHDLKVQSDVTYMDRTGNDVLQYRLQVELAF